MVVVPWAGTDYHSMQRQSRQHFAWSDAHYRPFVWRYLALRLAVERPDLVSRVTLIEPVMFAAAIARGAMKTRQ
jgi:hypothetical protein